MEQRAARVWSSGAKAPEVLPPNAHRQRCISLPRSSFASSPNIAQIAPAINDLASPIQFLLDEVLNLVGLAPENLLCFVVLAACLVLMCEGFRAADNAVGGRIALTGVAGATGTLWCRYEPRWGACVGHSPRVGTWTFRPLR